MKKLDKSTSLRNNIDLAALIRSKGLELTKSGKGFKALCPFHGDTNHSLRINPTENLWHCTTCGVAGDADRFEERFNNPALPKTGKESIAKQPAAKSDFVNNDKLSHQSAARTVKDLKLLARVVSYYQYTMGRNGKGIDYLKQVRNITDNRTLEDFGMGYADCTLIDTLPEDPEVIEALKRIGILTAVGHEFFLNCVVVPLYNAAGTIVNLYGRNVDEGSEFSGMYLPGACRGILNRQAVKRSKAILLTDSVMDAVLLYDKGFRNTMAIRDVNGNLEEHISLFDRNVQEVSLVFDLDESGQHVCEATARRLKEKGIESRPVRLPVGNIDTFFKKHTPEEFERLLKEAGTDIQKQSGKLDKHRQTLFWHTEHGFITAYGERQYEIKGIQRGDTQLKAVVKASSDVTGSVPFELSTIDLYSTRSRTWFGKQCANLFGASEELVREDLGRLITLVEEYKPLPEEPEEKKHTAEEEADAMRFLKNPDLFAEILGDLEILGITGEETNKLVGYLAAVSRKLDEPLSVMIQSRSAAGKSTLQDAILSLVPEEDYVKYTRVTDQALFYKEEDALVNKILAVEEEPGMGGAAYSIRNIQSAKRITVAATGKDPGTGKMKTEEYTVRGPVAVMITTTAAELDGETASRFLFLSIDESAKMTEAIHRKQREAETLEGLVRKKRSEHIVKKHHTAQRLLKALAVVNPFTTRLSYPSRSLKTRRDHKKYLGLIRAIAFLHQYQREIRTVEVEGRELRYIEVMPEDIEKANRLAGEILGQSLDELAPPSRTLLESIREMIRETAEARECPLDEIFFTRRMIREFTGWSDWQIRTHIRQLESLEYLYTRTGSQGREYAYALNYRGRDEGGGERLLNLTPVDGILKEPDKQA